MQQVVRNPIKALNGTKAIMRERLYRMKHYPVQEQARTRFGGATSTIMEVLGKSEKFQAFDDSLGGSANTCIETEPEAQGAVGN